MLTVGSCFSGIGGLELGLEWTGGFETKWQIEIDDYATRVLEKHWPNVKRYRDIRKIDTDELARVDLICGGYPCQPFSYAGKRQGVSDSRHLWPDMVRIIRFLRPRYVLLENVPGHLSMGFGQVLGDLAKCGYDAEWQVLSAASVGAPHLRKRVFILAYSRSIESGGLSSVEREEISPIGTSGENVAHSNSTRGGGRERPNKKGKKTSHRSPEVANPKSKGQVPRGTQRSHEATHAESIERSVLSDSERDGLEEPQDERISGRATDSTPNSGWWSTEPDMGRVAHGVSSRVDRLKCLGNAVVPQVAQKIGEMILQYEQSLTGQKGSNK